MSHCIDPGTSEVCTKHGVIISDIIGGNRSVLDKCFSNHVFIVSLRGMANNYLGFVIVFQRKFISW